MYRTTVVQIIEHTLDNLHGRDLHSRLAQRGWLYPAAGTRYRDVRPQQGPAAGQHDIKANTWNWGTHLWRERPVQVGALWTGSVHAPERSGAPSFFLNVNGPLVRDVTFHGRAPVRPVAGAIAPHH